MDKVRAFLSARNFKLIMVIILLVPSITGYIYGFSEYKDEISFTQLFKLYLISLLILGTIFILSVAAVDIIMGKKIKCKKLTLFLFLLIISPFVFIGVTLYGQMNIILFVLTLSICIGINGLYYYVHYYKGLRNYHVE